MATGSTSGTHYTQGQSPGTKPATPWPGLFIHTKRNPEDKAGASFDSKPWRMSRLPRKEKESEHFCLAGKRGSAAP